MSHPLTHCALTMVMFCVITPIANGRPLVCLPEGIKPDTVVGSERVKSKGTTTIRPVTASQLLTKRRARCQKGRLIDGKGREIHFLRLIGCWGNPPEDYQELLEKQRNELVRLKKKYTVIEIPCSLELDPRKISL
jgi:hypothetical protein